MAPKAVGPSTPPPPQSAPVQNAQPQSVQEAPKKSSGGLLALFGFKGSAPVKESGERVVSTGTPTTTIVPATPPTTPPATTAIPALAPTTTPAVTPIPSVTSARPTGTPVVATSYAPQNQSRVQPPVVAPAVSAAATPVPQASILPQPEKLLIILRDAARPEHRAWAADVLGSFDGWTNPKVVAGLGAAARDDKAATVRLICARNLGRMNVRTMAVLSAVQALKSDADAAVRAEAEKALHLLNNEPVASLSPRPSGR